MVVDPCIVILSSGLILQNGGKMVLRSIFFASLHCSWFNSQYPVFQLKVEDVRFSAYATTIRITKFHGLKLNKIDFESITEIKGKPGGKHKVSRKITLSTGYLSLIISAGRIHWPAWTSLEGALCSRYAKYWPGFALCKSCGQSTRKGESESEGGGGLTNKVSEASEDGCSCSVII
jgi:hypothetical protein